MRDRLGHQRPRRGQRRVFLDENKFNQDNKGKSRTKSSGPRLAQSGSLIKPGHATRTPTST